MTATPEVVHLDDNRDLQVDGRVTCVHCGAELGHRDTDYLARALRRERAPEASGPNIRVKAEVFVDQPMVLRQALCPQCYVVLQTEIVPQGEFFWRTSRLTPPVK